MKPFLIACATAIIVAVVGGVVLTGMQEPSADAFSTVGVRLGA